MQLFCQIGLPLAGALLIFNS